MRTKAATSSPQYRAASRALDRFISRVLTSSRRLVNYPTLPTAEGRASVITGECLNLDFRPSFTKLCIV
ncbi:MAG: hypothetical protein ACYTX0_60785, partial [Nostoc sp.]